MVERLVRGVFLIIGSWLEGFFFFMFEVDVDYFFILEVIDKDCYILGSLGR